VFPHEYRRALGELNAAAQAEAMIAKAKTSDEPSAAKSVPAK